jgi:hypothetical protein
MLILFPRDRCFLFLAVWRIFDWFNAFFCASCLLVGGDAEIRSLETPAGRSIKFPHPNAKFVQLRPVVYKDLRCNPHDEILFK